MSKTKKDELSDKPVTAAENHRIFLMRHGETEWNRTFRYQGSSDVDLNEIGCEQARRLAVRMARTVPDRVFASPLVRAYRTAEIIMADNAGNVPVEPCDDLREISFGFWEGLSSFEVEEQDGETLAQWRAAPFTVVPKGGESLEAVSSRAARAAAAILSGGGPGCVTFVVAHGAILRALLASLMRLEDANFLWRVRLDNCSVSVLDMWGRRPSLLTLNDTHHLRMVHDDFIQKLVFPA